MPDPEKKPDEKGGGGGDWKPPTREEWDAQQRQLQNKTEEAQRLHAAKEQREAAEKAKADEEAKKRGEHEQLLKQRDEELKVMRERMTKREAQDQADLDALVKDWPDNRKALVAGATPEEKLAHARKLAAEFSTDTKGNPPPPGPGGKRAPSSMGGYSSEMEFAQRDPSGYLKWKKEQKH